MFIPLSNWLRKAGCISVANSPKNVHDRAKVPVKISRDMVSFELHVCSSDKLPDTQADPILYSSSAVGGATRAGSADFTEAVLGAE